MYSFFYWRYEVRVDTEVYRRSTRTCIDTIQNNVHVISHTTGGSFWFILYIHIIIRRRQTMAQEERPGHCMCNACICCYDACDFEDFVFCCVGGCDCICIRYAECCAIGHDSLGCGMVTDASRDECCKIALFCCALGIVNPTTFCSSARQCLCFQTVCSLPFHEDYINEPVCACYGIQCCPKCGCCAAPPVAPMFEKLRNSKAPNNNNNNNNEPAMERE